MKYKYISRFKRFWFFISIIFCFSSILVFSQLRQDKDWSHRLIENFIKLHPDTIAYKNEAKSYKWNYEQGLILEAFYQKWKTAGDEKYFNYIKKNIDYYVQEDGSIKTYKISDFNIDNIAPGRQLLYLYEEIKSERSNYCKARRKGECTGH